MIIKHDATSSVLVTTHDLQEECAIFLWLTPDAPIFSVNHRSRPGNKYVVIGA